MMKKFLLICCLIFCVGCRQNAQDYVDENNKELTSGGTVVATFPDGSKLRHYHINIPSQPQGTFWHKEDYLVIEPKDPNNKSILINGQLYAPAENNE